MTTHFIPFHRSVSVPRALLGTVMPTAQHSAAPGQAMPANTLSLLGFGFGLGLGTIAHFDPFQCSVSVLRSAQPLAQQFVALVHETADRGELESPGTLGAKTCDHFDPFQRTENGSSRGCERLYLNQPTARQSVAETQVTPSSSAPECGKWAGLGLGTTDQVLPFQRSMRASPKPPDCEKLSPTAMQSLALMHHTPCENSPAIAAALCAGARRGGREGDVPATAAAARSDTPATRAARPPQQPGPPDAGDVSHAESLRSMLNWATRYDSRTAGLSLANMRGGQLRIPVKASCTVREHR